MPLMRLLKPGVYGEDIPRVLPEGTIVERSEEHAAELERSGCATRILRPLPTRRMPGWGREAKVTQAPETSRLVRK